MATLLLPPFGFLILWLLIFHLADCGNIHVERLCKGSTEGDNDLENAIVSILNTLTTVDSSTGFNMQSLTSNAGSHTVYGLAQCRGDVINTDQCAKCLQQAETALYANCMKRTHAVIWHDLCFIRFDVNNFFGSWKIDSGLRFVPNAVSTGSPPAFVRAVLALITDLNYSSAMSKVKYFAKQIATSISGLDGVKIFGMVQCTQDLTASDCSLCLTNLSLEMLSRCGGALGCTLFHTSCFVRYETYNFFLG